jgi:uncharacterized membrane protein YkoI
MVHTAALGLGWLLASATADASEPPARPILVAEGHISLDQAVKMAEQRFKARVVRAESQHDGDRIIYVLRMLNDSGRVWTVRVDASSGTVL